MMDREGMPADAALTLVLDAAASIVDTFDLPKAHFRQVLDDHARRAELSPDQGSWDETGRWGLHIMALPFSSAEARRANLRVVAHIAGEGEH